jgi:hypothetical protein
MTKPTDAAALRKAILDAAARTHADLENVHDAYEQCIAAGLDPKVLRQSLGNRAEFFDFVMDPQFKKDLEYTVDRIPNETLQEFLKKRAGS